MVVRWRQHASASVRTSRCLHQCHPHPSPPPSKGEGMILKVHGIPSPLVGEGGHALNACLESGLRNLNRTPRGASPAMTLRASRLDSHASRSEEHTSELQSLMRISYAVFCLKKKK